jgi:hypothetical protein
MPAENNNVQVVMTEISEEEEKELDRGKGIHLNRDNKYFNVEPDCCYLYGEFDFSPNSNDINKMYNANWFVNMNINKFMLSEYDYETHTVTSDKKGCRWYETNDLRIYLPYLYGCIGKPKRVIIFKEYIQNIAQKKAKERAKKHAKEKKEHSDYKVKLDIKRQNKVSNMKFTIKK